MDVTLDTMATAIMYDAPDVDRWVSTWVMQAHAAIMADWALICQASTAAAAADAVQSCPFTAGTVTRGLLATVLADGYTIHTLASTECLAAATARVAEAYWRGLPFVVAAIEAALESEGGDE